MTFVVGSLLIGAGISAAVGGVAASKANKAKKDGLSLAQNITDLENARTPIISTFLIPYRFRKIGRSSKNKTSEICPSTILEAAA